MPLPRALALLPLLAACTEYEFGGKVDHPGRDDSAAAYDPRVSDSAPGDSGTDTGVIPVGDDTCYDPGTAYDMQPAAGLVVTQSDIAFDITFEGSYAGYTSDLWLWEPSRVYVGTGHTTAEGTTVSAGTFPVDTELEFAIVVTDNGNTYYSGPATRNSDGFDHAAITYVGDCRWIVGFEDQYGGGDQDFNDIELSISGPMELKPVE